MSIATEITRISGNISDSLTAVANKGVTVPAGSNSDDLAGLIALIQTGGGGGGTTWTTLYDADTWISSASPNYFIINNYTTPLQQGETYRVTWGTGGTKYTSETIYDNTGTAYDSYVCGNAGLIGGTDTGEPYLLYRDSATRMLGVTNASGGQNIHITIELQTTSGGGSATLITKNITANGTYNASSDSADGYSTVTVNVPGSGVDIPVFTIDSYGTVTCNKTYAECLSMINNNVWHAECVTPNGTKYGASMTTDTDIVVTICDDFGLPIGTIYYSNVSLEVSGDLPSWLHTETFTTNGTYDVFSDGYALKEVIVNVPTGSTPSLQAKTNISPTTSSQTITADSGYDGLSSVQINAMPSGTAGTPTATKGTVSNHQISITPSVTNTTGYITGSTKTGTAVTVSASELVSGSETKTANGTYDVTNLASLVVNVPSSGGKNIQVEHGTKRIASSTYTDVGYEITVAKTGTYNVYWAGWRSSTSGTSGAQLYVNGSASGNAITTFDSSWTNVQNGSRTNVSLTKNDKVTLRARSRGSSYQMYIFFLSIEEA